MRKILLTAAALGLMAGNAFAETIDITVNGMVCSFCATGIEKKFMEDPAVEKVKIDLDTKLVSVTTKAGQTLDDAAVKKVISYGGYETVSITRKE